MRLSSLTSLRRAAARKAKATSHRVLGHRDAESGQVRNRLRGIAADVEAPGSLALVPRFAPEAQHGMMGEDDDADLNAEDMILITTQNKKFFEFWESKMAKMLEDQGSSNYIPISGNLYMYKSIAAFMEKAALFQIPQTAFVNVAFYLIMLLQIFAPLSLAVQGYNNIIFAPVLGEHGECLAGNGHIFGFHQFATYRMGSNSYGLSHAFMRILGLLFIFLFLMNGLYVLEQDRIETRKVTELALFFKSMKKQIKLKDNAPLPNPQLSWLWVGAIMNSACLILCSIAMLFLFVIEEGVKDLVMDAFGLAFLYNLDDIGGRLAFLDERWDEDFMGDLFGELSDEQGLLADAVEEAKVITTPDQFYFAMKQFVRVLIVLLPAAFIFVEMCAKD